MEIETRYYVEEYWIDHYLEGYIKEIKSRAEYIKDYYQKSLNNSGPVVVRFYDREVVVYDGKEYLGRPINNSDFISPYNGIKGLLAVLHPEEKEKDIWINTVVRLEDYKDELCGDTKKLK